MQYLISIAAGLGGAGLPAVLLFGRRRSRRRTDSKNDRPEDRVFKAGSFGGPFDLFCGVCHRRAGRGL